MRILVLGGTGMLGHKLVQVFDGSHEVWTTTRGAYSDIERFEIFAKDRTIPHIEINDFTRIEKVIATVRPEVVINAIGIVKQISTSKDVVQTLMVNSVFPHRLANLAGESHFRLICVGTDCVFDGERGYYSEDDIANAPDLYGKSKNLGEVIAPGCLTIRTSIIGRELTTGHSLVEWFLSNRGGKADGYAKAVYSGFPTVVLADILRNFVLKRPELSGMYHVSSEPINKYELLVMIKERFGTNIDINRVTDFEIDRSLDSTKFRNETGFSPLSWEKMIDLMADDAVPYGEWRK